MYQINAAKRKRIGQQKENQQKKKKHNITKIKNY